MSENMHEAVERQRKMHYKPMTDQQLIMAGLQALLELSTSRYPALQIELFERSRDLSRRVSNETVERE